MKLRVFALPQEFMDDIPKKARPHGIRLIGWLHRAYNNEWEGLIVNRVKIGALVVSLLLPLTAYAENWTKEQQEVLTFEEACLTTNDASVLKDCFHKDFVGWGMGSTVPTSKIDRLKLIDDQYENFESKSLLFKPLSVIVKGNMAVITYVDSAKITDKRTKEVEYYTGRWTDICLKDGGKWYWISDHGVNLSSD